MTVLNELRALVRGSLTNWRSLNISELQYFHPEIRVWMLAAAGVLLLFAILRLSLQRQPGRHHIVLPALPSSIKASRGSFLTSIPTVIFIIGLLFFSVAWADPHSSLVTRETSFQGRRVGIIVDGSASMLRDFQTSRAGAQGDSEPVFFTAVAAAKRFVELRLNGKYHDLLSLIEFGNEAYVVTPFTNDYDNILLSISLIGDPTEFDAFPDSSDTAIGVAIQQGVALFKAFNFLDAAGNLLVVFSDGQDTRATINGVSLDDIMKGAVEAQIPVYFVRTRWGMDAGRAVGDSLWFNAVAKTGGRFFAAKDDNSLIEAVNEIDKLGPGTIFVKQYADRQRPRFAMFAELAIACWSLAAAAKLTIPYFRRSP